MLHVPAARSAAASAAHLRPLTPRTIVPVLHLASRICAVFAIILALVTLPRSSTAQDVTAGPSSSDDSLAFRRGQWGAIVAIDQRVAALGVLRFRSPRTAWVLNANASGIAGETDLDMPDAEQDSKAAGFGARLGLRRYRPLERRVAAYSGAGVTGTASFLDVQPSAGDELSARMYGAGLYGELGVEYRAARYVAIGVRSLADVTGRWGSETRTTGAGTTTRTDRREVGASIGRLEVLATLYF